MKNTNPRRNRPSVHPVKLLLALGRLLLLVASVAMLAAVGSVFAAGHRPLVPPLPMGVGAPYAHVMTGRAASEQTTQAAASTYSIQLHFDGYGAIELSPSGPYTSNDIITAKADPAPGYQFDHWSGVLSGNQNPITFSINGPAYLTATFSLKSVLGPYDISTDVVGGGRIETTPAGPFADGQVATLTAVPDAGWRFVRWSGDIGGWENPRQHTLIEDTYVIAVFALEEEPPAISLPPINLMVAIDGHGAVMTTPSGPFTAGQAITLTALAADGWHFDGWEGRVKAAGNPYVMTILTDTVLAARFLPDVASPPLSLTVNVQGEGEVLAEPAGPYVVDQPVTLSVIPQTGWRFAGWSGATDGSANPQTFAIAGNAAITATFVPEASLSTARLDVRLVGLGDVQATPSPPYYLGQAITVTAQPAIGWHFKGWNENVDPTANQYTFVITGDTTITATFTAETTPPEEMLQPQPTLVVQVAGAGVVMTDAQPPYHNGQIVTVTAEPEAGWRFAGWDGAFAGLENPIALTLTGNVEVMATFAPLPTSAAHAVTLAVSGAGKAILAPDGPYKTGDVVVLAAMPDQAYCFQGWQGDLTGADNPVAIEVTQDHNVTAQFGPCPLLLPMVAAR